MVDRRASINLIQVLGEDSPVSKNLNRGRHAVSHFVFCGMTKIVASGAVESQFPGSKRRQSLSRANSMMYVIYVLLG